MDFKDQVKNAADIADVVGTYIQLRKAGPNRYSGRCPFHQEKTPSFSVNTTKQFYYCFGCKQSGDVFKFVQELEGWSFYEALKHLAERYGIPIPQRGGLMGEADEETKLRAALYRMHEIAQKHFAANLFSQAGGPAKEYLKARGLNREAAETFGLGYSDPAGQGLIRLLQAENFTASQLKQSGLVRERDGGGFYDTFRGRLMFPIHSESAKLIGFGGRALGDDIQPKYLNTEETAIYKKKDVLYNMNRAKESIRKLGHVILVEGYMDVIGVYMGGGVHEVVASCGTALGSSQIRAMKRHTDTIYVNFDSDSAGVNATSKGIPLLLQEGFKVWVVELEDGLDPDEYIKKYGADRYRERLAKSTKYFHWMADQARRKHGISAEGRVEALKSLLPAIQDVQDPSERLAISDELADLMGVTPEERVRSGFRNAARDRRGQAQPRFQPKLPPLERELLQALLEGPEVREAILGPLLGLTTFETLAARAIFEELARMVESGVEVTFSGLEARLENPQKALMHELISADEFHETGDLDRAMVQAMNCLESLQEEDTKQKLAELKGKIRTAERSGQLEEALRLNEELERLRRKSAGRPNQE